MFVAVALAFGLLGMALVALCTLRLLHCKNGLIVHMRTEEARRTAGDAVRGACFHVTAPHHDTTTTITAAQVRTATSERFHVVRTALLERLNDSVHEGRMRDVLDDHQVWRQRVRERGEERSMGWCHSPSNKEDDSSPTDDDGEETTLRVPPGACVLRGDGDGDGGDDDDGDGDGDDDDDDDVLDGSTARSAPGSTMTRTG